MPLTARTTHTNSAQVDLATDKLVFFWSALENIHLNESYIPALKYAVRIRSQTTCTRTQPLLSPAHTRTLEHSSCPFSVSCIKNTTLPQVDFKTDELHFWSALESIPLNESYIAVLKTNTCIQPLLFPHTRTQTQLSYPFSAPAHCLNLGRPGYGQVNLLLVRSGEHPPE